MKAATRQAAAAYAMLAPALILFTTFIGIPMVLAFVIAFKHIDLAAGIDGSPWVGLQNFRDLFDNVLLSERISLAFRNTLLFTVCFVPLNLLAALVIATLINAVGEKGRNFYRAAFYLPAVTSAIVFAMIWKWLYDSNFGLLNAGLEGLGLPRVNWTGDPDWAIWSVIIAALGAGPGGNVLIYLAALGSVPEELQEAARVDGANVLQRWWNVTVPALKPVTLYLLVLNTIGSFQVFELVFVLTSGGPAGSSTVVVYEIYNLAFAQGRYGVAGALSLILLLVVTLFTALQFFVLGRNDASKASFTERLLEPFNDAIGSVLGAAGAMLEKLGKLFPTRAGGGSLRFLRHAPPHFILFPFAILFLLPMAWMFVGAFTGRTHLQSSPPDIALAHLTTENYQRLFTGAPMLGRWVWNSFYLALLIGSVQVLLSALAGYVFARLAFPGRKAIFAAFIAAIILPGQALLIPLFIVISNGFRDFLRVDLMDTHWAMILPGLCSPVGIFLMKQFIEGLPKELEEAARIDGCGEFAIWYRVVLPLCRPVLGAWGILTFTAVWKSFFWPFVVLGTGDLFTLEVGLQTLQQQNEADFGLVMAGATISAVPMIVIFFIFQKQIVSGLTFGAVKG